VKPNNLILSYRPGGDRNGTKAATLTYDPWGGVRLDDRIGVPAGLVAGGGWRRAGGVLVGVLPGCRAGGCRVLPGTAGRGAAGGLPGAARL
jgi:hypothetical protein